MKVKLVKTQHDILLRIIIDGKIIEMNSYDEPNEKYLAAIVMLGHEIEYEEIRSCSECLEPVTIDDLDCPHCGCDFTR